MIVYHGTRNAERILVEGFTPSTGGEFGPGIYFADNPDTAAFYALRVARGPDAPTVLRGALDLVNPFMVQKVDWIKMTERQSPRTVQRRLARRGYDGIIGIGISGVTRQIVAFDDRAIDPSSVRVHTVIG